MKTERLGAPIIIFAHKASDRVASYLCWPGRFYVLIFDLFRLRGRRRVGSDRDRRKSSHEEGKEQRDGSKFSLSIDRCENQGAG
jgi:hypothetical protein